MDIGFIGLGTMGSRIAANLVKAGHKVRVWNRSRPSVDTLAALGATPVSTAREAFSGDAVFSILADDAAVRAVIEPLLEGAPKGLVHVNMATISIVLVRDLSARHREHGVSYVAATVFGRPELAADETMSSSLRRLFAADAVDAALSTAIRTRTTAEWVAEGDRNRIPITPMPTPGELPHHEHWSGRGWRHVQVPGTKLAAFDSTRTPAGSAGPPFAVIGASSASCAGMVISGYWTRIEKLVEIAFSCSEM